MPTVEDIALPAEASVVDRRRDGRIDYSNPHLIDLLRRREFVEPVAPAEPEAAQVFVVVPPARTGSAATSYIVVTTLCFWAVVAAMLWKTMAILH